MEFEHFLYLAAAILLVLAALPGVRVVVHLGYVAAAIIVFTYFVYPVL